MNGEVDYKKVRAAIRETVSVLEDKEPFDDSFLIERKKQIQRALEGCWWYEILG